MKGEYRRYYENGNLYLEGHCHDNELKDLKEYDEHKNLVERPYLKQMWVVLSCYKESSFVNLWVFELIAQYTRWVYNNQSIFEILLA